MTKSKKKTKKPVTAEQVPEWQQTLSALPPEMQKEMARQIGKEAGRSLATPAAISLEKMPLDPTMMVPRKGQFWYYEVGKVRNAKPNTLVREIWALPRRKEHCLKLIPSWLVTRHGALARKGYILGSALRARAIDAVGKTGMPVKQLEWTPQLGFMGTDVSLLVNSLPIEAIMEAIDGVEGVMSIKMMQRMKSMAREKATAWDVADKAVGDMMEGAEHIHEYLAEAHDKGMKAYIENFIKKRTTRDWVIFGITLLLIGGFLWLVFG
jgi:hypothetical protein